MQKLLGLLVAGGSAVLLVACGGGGDSSTSNATPVGSSGAPVSQTPTTVTLANAGASQNVATGAVVVLDGSKSTSASNNNLKYTWTLTSKPAGSNAVLIDAASAKPTFNADVAGAYVATLTVSDGTTTSAPVSVTVTAAVGNVAPVAQAGPAQNVVTGSAVILDGSGSSDTDTPAEQLSYRWTLSKVPPGSTSSLISANTVKPTFTPDIDGQYEVTLAVNDGKLSSAPATVTIVATKANSAPVANAGAAQAVATGALVSLDASTSSDANGDALTLAWVLTSKPVNSTATLSSVTAQRPTFTADIDGTYVATLVVNDGKVASAPSTVAVTATAPKTLGVAYVARNGLKVTLNSMTTVDQGNGYNAYTINYTQTNPTSVAIDEATFKLYFSNDAAMAQYGFFDRVYPGMPVSRSYTFTQLKTSTPAVLEYDADNFFANKPVSGSLQWNLPVVSAPVAAESLNLSSNDMFTGTRQLAMPYSSTLAFNQTIVGGTSAKLQTYQLTAVGKDYTISTLQATDSTGTVVPRFEGLTVGQVIRAGTTATFSLVTPLTGGRTVNLTYSFVTQDATKSFTVNANGLTN